MRPQVIALLAGCRFVPGELAPMSDAPPDATVDVSLDEAVPPSFCPVDANLRVCFSFDQPTLDGALPNEGAGSVSAQLTAVTSIASPLGRAAQLDASSIIYLAMGSGVTNIQAIEIWYRFDTAIANDGGRMGLVDSNTNPNISLFFYRQDPGHTLRCGIGQEALVWPATLTTSTWYHLVCTCDGTNLEMYVNGTLISEMAAPCAGGGSIVADGFTIGSNNNASPTAVNDQLLGAVDGVRLWDVPKPPSQD